MKRNEAVKIAEERMGFINNQIEQILSMNNQDAYISFGACKENGQTYLTIDIQVYDTGSEKKDSLYHIMGKPWKKSDEERHFNLGITQDHSEVLYAMVLDSLLRYVTSDTIEISPFMDIMSMMGPGFHGVYLENTVTNTILSIDIDCKMELRDNYYNNMTKVLSEQSGPKL